MRRSGKQFVYRVEDGQGSVKKWSASRYSVPRTPKNHEWLPGQEVVYIQPTAAGWMPTSLVGTIIDLLSDGRSRKAIVRWHADTLIAPTISFQRLRPRQLIHDFLS